jgi:hypothetical protein
VGVEQLLLAPHVLAPVNTVPLQEAAGQSGFTLHWTQPTAVLHSGVDPVQSTVVGVEHVFPVQALAGVNTAPLQEAAAQSEPVLHCTQPSAVLQTGVDPVQSTVVGVEHVFPVQALAGVNTAPLQEAAAQSEPVLHCTQLPLPSQTVPP